MKSGIYILLLSFMIASVISGCYYDNEEELYPNQAGCDTTNVTYSKTIQPLVAYRCSVPGCHVPGAQLPDLSTYAGLTANIDRVRVRALELKTMPPAGPLPPCEIAQMQIWIAAGSPNN